jgi:hypothetical protein
MRLMSVTTEIMRRFWGPPSLLFKGIEDTFPGVERPVRKADHSPPSSDEVKKNEAVLPLPHKPLWRLHG